jgi:hypothetical protein
MKKVNLFLRFFFRFKFRAYQLPSAQYRQIVDSEELLPHLFNGSIFTRVSWFDFAFGDTMWHFNILSGELD